MAGRTRDTEAPGDGTRAAALIARLHAARVIDPDEVAVFLEEHGINDQAARREYGEHDVFTLADRLHTRLCSRATAARHAAEPVRWDWRGLGRARLLAVRLVAAALLAAAAEWLGPAALLPAVAGVPLGESLVAWHQGQVRWGLVSYDTALAWRRHLHGLGWRALALLATPLLAGAALAGIARADQAGPGGPHLAGHLPALGTAGPLALAVGALLAGGYGILLLLAARGRVLAGTALAAGCCAAAVLVQPVPARAGLAVAGYLAGLLLAAHAALDPTQGGEIDL